MHKNNYSYIHILTYVYPYHKVLTFNQNSNFQNNSHLLKNGNIFQLIDILGFETLTGSDLDMCRVFPFFSCSCANMAAI